MALCLVYTEKMTLIKNKKIQIFASEEKLQIESGSLETVIPSNGVPADF